MRVEPVEHKDEHAQSEARKPRRGVVLRLLSLLTLSVLLLGSIMLVVYRDSLNMDMLRRAVTYRNLQRDEDGAAEVYAYGADATNRFASFEKGLLVASGSGFRLFGASGMQLVFESIYLSSPVIDVGGRLAVIYDAGGTTLRAVTNREVVFSLDLEEGRSIFSARTNDAGYLAITAQERGYKPAVVVYNSKFRRLFQLNISSGFAADAVVSSDNQYLAAITLGQADGSPDSRLLLYRLDSEEESASYALGDLLPLDLRYEGGVIRILGDRQYCAVSESGELLGSYDYGSRYLRDYSMEGDGYTALLLSKYRAGRGAALVLLDPSGAPLGELALSEEVFFLSAAGRYVALLCADRLDVYTSDLKQYATLRGTERARSVLMREDGSVLLIGSEQARLFVP